MKKILTYKQFENMELAEFIKKVKGAKILATQAHKGQKRRGGGDYIQHPEEVAKLVYKVKKSKRISDLIAAAWLHDTVEDTGVKIKEIKKEFGEIVASLVSELTSNPEELEKLGKETYLINKMLNMSSWGLIIKLADRLHNVSDIPDKLKNGSDKEKSWAKRYSLQTNNIIRTLEEERELSEPQKKLIKLIKKKIQDALTQEVNEEFKFFRKKVKDDSKIIDFFKNKIVCIEELSEEEMIHLKDQIIKLPEEIIINLIEYMIQQGLSFNGDEEIRIKKDKNISFMMNLPDLVSDSRYNIIVQKNVHQ